jgi:hypothetical protein
MNKYLKKFLYGSLVGLIAPMIALFIYWIIYWRNYNFIPSFFIYLYNVKQIGNHLSLACIINLPIFYILINKEKPESDKLAQGIIFGTLTYAVYIFYYKIFVDTSL